MVIRIFCCMLLGALGALSKPAAPPAIMSGPGFLNLKENIIGTNPRFRGPVLGAPPPAKPVQAPPAVTAPAVAAPPIAAALPNQPPAVPPPPVGAPGSPIAPNEAADLVSNAMKAGYAEGVQYISFGKDEAGQNTTFVSPLEMIDTSLLPKTPGVALPNGGKPVAPLAPVAAAPSPIAAPAMTPAAPCAAAAPCAQPFATPANRQAPAPVPAPAPPARGMPVAAQTPVPFRMSGAPVAPVVPQTPQPNRQMPQPAPAPARQPIKG